MLHAGGTAQVTQQQVLYKQLRFFPHMLQDSACLCLGYNPAAIQQSARYEVKAVKTFCDKMSALVAGTL